MLIVNITDESFFNEETSTFVETVAETFVLEHSLVSLSKWESKWETPFLSSDDKTHEQALDYLKCMVVDPLADLTQMDRIGDKEVEEIQAYINSAQTATTFASLGEKKAGRREIITSELVYFWMTQLSIPFECEQWHLNRLFSLIQIASIKNGPQKKLSKREHTERNAAENTRRRAMTGSSG